MANVVGEFRQHFEPISSFLRRPESWAWRSAGLIIVGLLALTVVTLTSFWLNLDFATSAFAHLTAIVLLSMMASPIASAVLSVIAIGFLKYLFAEPHFTLEVQSTHELLTIVAFLTTSFVITTLLRRVNQLRQREHEKAHLLDSTAEAIFVRDLDGIITYWNRGAEELYGWKREEAIGKRARELLQPALTGSLESLDEVNRTLLRNERMEREVVDRARDGSKIATVTRWSLMRNESGNPIGAFVTKTDVTERRRAEEALRHIQSAYLAEAQRLSLTGSFGWNVMTGEIFWSEESFRIFGYDPTGKPSIETVLRRVHPDDVRIVRQIIEQAAAERRGFDFERRLLMTDGSEKYLHVVANVVIDEPGRLEFAGAMMDVTARTQNYAALEASERRYRNLFHQMPVAFLQLDARKLVELFNNLRVEGVNNLSLYFDEHPKFLAHAMDSLIVEEVNEQAIRFFGATNAADMVGKPVTPLYRASPNTFRRDMESRFRGEPIFTEETKYSTFDDRVVDGFLTIARISTPDGFTMSVAGIIDLTERVRAQQRLRQVEADVARAARISVLGELTATIAHEVNQPLGAIAANGEAGLLWLDRSEPDVPEARQLLARIVADAHRAADIISHIRGMAGRGPAGRTSLPLREVLDEAMVLLRHEIQSNEVVASLELPAALPPVLGNRAELQQVIVNLAINGIQAMTQGKTARRILAIRAEHSNPETVTCVIEDSGPGIVSKEFGRLFDSFFTTKDSGMGMGLAISRTIIEAHGGKLSADNESAHGGARFRFTLPIAVDTRG